MYRRISVLDADHMMQEYRKENGRIRYKRGDVGSRDACWLLHQHPNAYCSTSDCEATSDCVATIMSCLRVCCD